MATVQDGEGTPHGVTVNSFTSVSLEPPLVLFCLEKEAGVYAAFMEANYYGINILGDEQRVLSDRFAFFTGDRFAGLEWRPGLAPRLPGTLAWMAVRVDTRVDAGDHTIFLGTVEEAEALEGRPLLYFQSQYRSLPE